MDNQKLSAGERVNGPTTGVIRAQLQIRRWPNLSAHSVERLVNPNYLVAITRAVDNYVEIIKRRTIPGLSSDERFVPLTRRGECWLVNTQMIPPDLGILESVRSRWILVRFMNDVRFRDALQLLGDECSKLEQQWPAVLGDAQQRLGDQFSENDFPLVGQIWRHFIAWCQFSDRDEINTKSVLGRLSTLWPADSDSSQSLDLFDAFDLARKLQQLRTERDAGRISEEEFRKQCSESFRHD